MDFRYRPALRIAPVVLTLSTLFQSCTSAPPRVPPAPVAQSAPDPAARSAAPTLPQAAVHPLPPPDFPRILFLYDHAGLTPLTRPIIRQVADLLLKHDTLVVEIAGHCDERGTDDYNTDLGWKRAYTVRDALRRLGIADARLRPMSYGRARPLVIGNDESAWSLNRRVEFVPRNPDEPARRVCPIATPAVDMCS